MTGVALREAAFYRVTSLSIIKQAQVVVQHYTDHESDCSISRRCIYCTFQNNYAILHVGVWTFSKYIDQICIIFLTKTLTVLNIHTFPTLTFKKDLAALIQ